MAVVIGEIVTEVVAAPRGADGPTAAGDAMSDEAMDAVVRRATERVLEILRREWDQ